MHQLIQIVGVLLENADQVGLITEMTFSQADRYVVQIFPELNEIDDLINYNVSCLTSSR